MMSGERLQKLLARAGLGSRRQIEQWIRDGRIKVNGRVASLGLKADSSARIQLDGRPVRLAGADPTPKVIVLNKPLGVICTRKDPEHRPTVFDGLPRLKGERWLSVGRLDINTAGLLLLTTDGELANRLMHPKYQLEREYLVRVHGEVPQAVLKKLLAGVMLEDGEARFTRVRYTGGGASNHWYKVVLTEGRNREVRRLWEAVGYQVSKLIRTAYGPIELKRSLKPGSYEALKPKQIAKLYTLTGLQV